MSFMVNILKSKGAGALALGAALAFLPISASALTIGIRDNATAQQVIINSGDLGLDQSAGTPNVVSTSGLTVGQSSVTFTLSFFTDANGTSVLSLAGSGTAGSDGMLMDAYHEGFGAGAGDPSLVNFSSNPSSISGSVISAGYVNNNNNGALFFQNPGTLVGSQEFTSVSDGINVTRPFSLEDPFAMTIFTTFSAGSSMTFDSTLTATPIPLPAGGLLLLTALGGMAVLRRKRKAA